MASLVNLTDINRNTIADGDKLNGNLITLSGNDAIVMNTLSDTHDTIETVKNTVNTHSASWDNSKIVGFRRVYFNDYTGDGAPKFEKYFTFSAGSALNIIPTIYEEFPLVPNTTGFLLSLNNFALTRTPTYYYSCKYVDVMSTHNDGAILFKPNMLSFANIEDSLYMACADGKVHSTENGPSATNSAVCMTTNMSYTYKSVNNSTYISTLTSVFEGTYDNQVTLLSHQSNPAYVETSSIGIKGGAGWLNNKSISFGMQNTDNATTYTVTQRAEHSSLICKNAIDTCSTPLTASYSAMSLFEGIKLTNPVVRTDKSIANGGGAHYLKDCSISLDAYTQENNSYTVCCSSIALGSLNLYTPSLMYGAVGRKSLQLGHSNGDTTTYNQQQYGGDVPEEFAENIFVTTQAGYKAKRTIGVKGIQNATYNDDTIADCIWVNSTACFSNSTATIFNTVNGMYRSNAGVRDAVSSICNDSTIFNKTVNSIMGSSSAYDIENCIVMDHTCLGDKTTGQTSKNSIIGGKIQATTRDVKFTNTIANRVEHAEYLYNVTDSLLNSCNCAVTNGAASNGHTNVEKSIIARNTGIFNSVGSHTNDIMLHGIQPSGSFDMRVPLTACFVVDSNWQGGHEQSIYYQYYQADAAHGSFFDNNTNYSTISICNTLSDVYYLQSNGYLRSIFFNNTYTNTNAMNRIGAYLRYRYDSYTTTNHPNKNERYNAFIAHNGNFTLDTDGCINNVAFITGSYTDNVDVDTFMSFDNTNDTLVIYSGNDTSVANTVHNRRLFTVI